VPDAVTFSFTDATDGDECFVSVTTDIDRVRLVVSKRGDGDVDVSLPPAIAHTVAVALSASGDVD
jgi:hypothetical protein